jgi:hypothetical protein
VSSEPNHNRAGPSASKAKVPACGCADRASSAAPSSKARQNDADHSTVNDKMTVPYLCIRPPLSRSRSSTDKINDERFGSFMDFTAQIIANKIERRLATRPLVPAARLGSPNTAPAQAT